MCSACIKKHTEAALVSVLVETINISAAALLFVLFLQLLKKKKQIFASLTHRFKALLNVVAGNEMKSSISL